VVGVGVAAAMEAEGEAMAAVLAWVQAKALGWGPPVQASVQASARVSLRSAPQCQRRQSPRHRQRDRSSKPR